MAIDDVITEESGRAATGQDAGLRRIWLCADDYGLAPGVNSAIRDLVARGHLNATSTMMVTPSTHRSEVQALTLLNTNETKVAIGLHVTLTGPFKPLTDYAPVRAGTFLPLTSMIGAAFARRLDRAVIATEIEAQIKAFIAAFGQAPVFVDGHQHVQLLPDVREAFLQVVKTLAPNAWVRQCGSALPFWRGLRSDRKALFLNWLSQEFRRQAQAAGVETNTGFAGTYEFRSGTEFERLFPAFLADLPEGGLVMCHPGIVDAELEQLDPLTMLREHEYAYFRNPYFQRILASHGVALA